MPSSKPSSSDEIADVVRERAERDARRQVAYKMAAIAAPIRIELAKESSTPEQLDIDSFIAARRLVRSFESILEQTDLLKD